MMQILFGLIDFALLAVSLLRMLLKGAVQVPVSHACALK